MYGESKGGGGGAQGMVGNTGREDGLFTTNVIAIRGGFGIIFEG